MAAQALSGIAKDLNKMSVNTIKLLVPDDKQGQLYKWVVYLRIEEHLKRRWLFPAVSLTLIGFKARYWLWR